MKDVDFGRPVSSTKVIPLHMGNDTRLLLPVKETPLIVVFGRSVVNLDVKGVVVSIEIGIPE